MDSKSEKVGDLEEGQVAANAVTSLFSGPRREEVVQVMPRDYQPGAPPSGPCAYEISQFLQCATMHDQLEPCEPYSQALRECKRRNNIP